MGPGGCPFVEVAWGVPAGGASSYEHPYRYSTLAAAGRRARQSSTYVASLAMVP
jgi:hypothetical protein